MILFSDVKTVSKRFNLTMQKALNCIHKAEKCSKCNKQGMLEYFDSDSSMSSCLFCDYTIE